MIATFVTLEGKKEWGVGKQNFQYAPKFKEFMLILCSYGWHAYELIAAHIPMMEDQSILCVSVSPPCSIMLIPHQRRFNELCVPHFPIVIFPQSFSLSHLILFAVTSKNWDTLDQLGCRVITQSYRQPFTLIGIGMQTAMSSWAVAVTQFRCQMLSHSGS